MGESVMMGTMLPVKPDLANLEYVGAATMAGVKYISSTQFGTLTEGISRGQEGWGGAMAANPFALLGLNWCRKLLIPM
jgi:hypothetical protein